MPESVGKIRNQKLSVFQPQNCQAIKACYRNFSVQELSFLGPR